LPAFYSNPAFILRVFFVIRESPGAPASNVAIF
jgi:hypothetical protein